MTLRAEHPTAVGAPAQASPAGRPSQDRRAGTGLGPQGVRPRPAACEFPAPKPRAPRSGPAEGARRLGLGCYGAPAGWGWGVSVQLVSLRMSMAPALQRPGALRSRCSRHPAVPAWTGLGSQRSHSEGLGAPLTLTNERLPQTDARVLGARAGCGLTAGPCRGRGWRRSVTAGQPHGPTVLGAHIWQTPRQNVLETFSCSIHSRRQGHCQSPIAREGPGD